MDMVTTFLGSPAVAPIWTIFVIGVIDFLFAIWRAQQQGVFDLKKVPQLLETLVLAKITPVVLLGVGAFATTVPTEQAAFMTAYLAACAAVFSSQVPDLIAKISGSYKATPA